MSNSVDTVRPEEYGLSKPPGKRFDLESSGKTEAEKHAEDLKVIDAVWGEIREDGPNYRNLGW
jgi:hypothetical protein